MPVNEADLAAYIDELGLSDAVRTSILSELKGNDRAATQFVGQRLRHADYTKKSQALSTERTQLEDAANKQIGTYAQQLQAAETRIQSIMKDFEGEAISRTTAETRLRAVKEKYALSDDDIPPVTTPAAAARTADTTIDIDAKLKAFGTALIADMRREMSHVPDLNALQFDIVRRHRELTGKDITSDELRSLNKDGAKHKDGLMGAWTDKFEINRLQTERDYTSRLTAERTKWEDEQKAQRSNEAMAQATSSSKDPSFTASSAVLKRSFERRDDPATQSTTPTSQQPQTTQTHTTPSAVDRNKVSGAERAAAKWIERASSGQLGKPVAA